ncbi:MAG: amidohydrolase family protein, partial [Methylomicrobium sp.]|nr:amidohydrolase family protein [Methylomicrobium sp.]
LVDEKLITLSRGIASLTQNPATILRLESGTLTPGKSADICIFDPGRRWQVDRSTWYSKGINTPYWGETLTGRVNATLQSGKIIYHGVFHD